MPPATTLAATGPTKKVCTKCGKTRALTEFYKAGPNGHRPECKACYRVARGRAKAGPGRPRRAAAAPPKPASPELQALVDSGRVRWHQCDGADAHPLHREIHRRGFWTEGYRVVAFVETICHYPDGPKVGEVVGAMIPWQREATYEMFTIRADGHRQFRRVLIGVAKKNNKTGWASWIAAYCLVDNHFKSGQIVCAAASEDQADLVFGYAKATCEASETLKKLTGGEGRQSLRFEREMQIIGQPMKSLKRLAVGGGTLDGRNLLFVVEDELHEWTTPKSQATHTVLNRGTILNPDSTVCMITTAGFDPDTIEGRMYDYGSRVQNGEVSDPTFLMIWYEAPEVCSGKFAGQGPFEGRKGEPLDYRSREGFMAANPSAGYTVTYERYLDDLDDPEMTEAVAMRYHLNRHTNVEELWMPVSWSSLGEQGIVFTAEDRIVCGIDSATSVDSTAITLWKVSGWGAELRAWSRSWVWERPLRADGKPVEGWTTPFPEVTAHLYSLHFGTGNEDHELAPWCKDGVCVHCGEAFPPLMLEQVGYDPARIAALASEWAQAGLPMQEIPQGKRMAQGFQTWYQLLATDRFRHDGSAVVERHVRGSTVRLDTDGNRRLDRRRTSTRLPNDAAITQVICGYLVTDPDEEASDPQAYD